MRERAGLLRKCVIGAVLTGAGLVSTGAQAQTAQTAQAADPIPYWWFHGNIEVGGRFFTNSPQRDGNQVRNGTPDQNGQNLAKFYEYRDLRPGPFSNIWLSTGTNDGLYQIDVFGKNIGYDDQQYGLDASKAGQQYFNFQWDQSPHLYSTTAQTFYQGVGTTSLTLPPGFVKGATGAAVVPFLYTTDLGIKRDTASVSYRWTPDDAWDIKADYSHLHRSGTQVDGVVGFGTGFGYGPTQVPRPVDDTTQNFGVNGEYVGTSPWGKRFNFKLAYNGSVYSDDFTSYTIADPIAGGVSGNFARESTWPSNNANAFSGTLGADLPWNSRYAGTLSYTAMRQNESFIPMSAQVPGFPLPASSLNGAINTLLSNNIITTKITPELTSKLSYRYYNFDNQTPQILFPCQPAGAVNCTTAWISYDKGLPAGEKTIQSLSMQYVKQNAGADLNWRPSREWNLGVAYGYERYDYTQVDATSTDENSGKVYADWKPTSWTTFRASGYYSKRSANNYNYLNNVEFIQFPNTTVAGNSFFYNPAYRQLMIDGRERWKANFALDVVVARGLTVTPTFKYQDDYYPDVNGVTLGLQDSKSWSAGIDATYVINPDTSVSVGYMYENYAQLLYGSSSTSNTAVVGVAGVYSAQTNDRTTVNTFTGAIRYAAIPDRLNLSLRYTLSAGVDNMKLNLANGAQPSDGQSRIIPPISTAWMPSQNTSLTRRKLPNSAGRAKLSPNCTTFWRVIGSNWQDDSWRRTIFRP